jgi:hypothetical protein
VCEHTFVHDHSRARLSHALLTKDVAQIDAVARTLTDITLDEALRILMVLAQQRDPRFPRAAARFAARVVIERRLAPAEAHRVLVLAEMIGEAPDAVRTMLRRYCA